MPPRHKKSRRSRNGSDGFDISLKKMTCQKTKSREIVRWGHLRRVPLRENNIYAIQAFRQVFWLASYLKAPSHLLWTVERLPFGLHISLRVAPTSDSLWVFDRQGDMIGCTQRRDHHGFSPCSLFAHSARIRAKPQSYFSFC